MPHIHVRNVETLNNMERIKGISMLKYSKSLLSKITVIKKTLESGRKMHRSRVK